MGEALAQDSVRRPKYKDLVRSYLGSYNQHYVHRISQLDAELLNGESRERSCKLNLVAKNGHTCWTWWRNMNILAESSGERRNYQLNLQLLTAMVFSWY